MGYYDYEMHYQDAIEQSGTCGDVAGLAIFDELISRCQLRPGHMVLLTRHHDHPRQIEDCECGPMTIWHEIKPNNHLQQAEARLATLESNLQMVEETAMANGAFTPGDPGKPTVEANNREAYRQALFSLLAQIEVARAAVAHHSRSLVERAEEALKSRVSPLH